MALAVTLTLVLLLLLELWWVLVMRLRVMNSSIQRICRSAQSLGRDRRRRTPSSNSASSTVRVVDDVAEVMLQGVLVVATLLDALRQVEDDAREAGLGQVHFLVVGDLADGAGFMLVDAWVMVGGRRWDKGGEGGVPDVCETDR